MRLNELCLISGLFLGRISRAELTLPCALYIIISPSGFLALHPLILLSFETPPKACALCAVARHAALYIIATPPRSDLLVSR